MRAGGAVCAAVGRCLLQAHRCSTATGGTASGPAGGPRGSARCRGAVAELWALRVPRCHGQAVGHHHPAGVTSRCQGCPSRCEITDQHRSGVEHRAGLRGGAPIARPRDAARVCAMQPRGTEGFLFVHWDSQNYTGERPALCSCRQDRTYRCDTVGVRAPGGCNAQSTPVGSTFTNGKQQHRNTQICVVRGQFFRLFYFSASKEINIGPNQEDLGLRCPVLHPPRSSMSGHSPARCSHTCHGDEITPGSGAEALGAAARLGVTGDLSHWK